MKVLVVDDDRMMVRTMCYILNYEGIETVEAYSGEEAVEKVRTEEPDCVLMDVRLPGISGVDAMKELIGIAPDLPVVLMSAYSTDELIGEARSLGAYTVLTKPIDIEMILLLLEALRNEGSIFIIDDDPHFCKTMSYILQAKGYRVETEVDPARVSLHLEKNGKLVILLDLKLGAVDGLEVLKELRGKHPAEPVVLVTAFREELDATIAKGLRIGAHACLYKPLEIGSVLRTIGDIRRRRVKTMMGERV